MNFNNHSNLEGQHAFLGASKFHWINYSEDKVADAYRNFLATQKGTMLHAFAAQCITLGQKLPKSQKTLNMYVNDAIGFKMTPEQMAVYSDNMPDGVDVIFNTNKKSGTPTKDVLKKIKDDPDNPFGSLIKEHGGQSYYDDPKGKYTDPVTGKKQSLSLINKRAEEGDWGEWSKTLPSQFLSKQSLTLT